MKAEMRRRSFLRLSSDGRTAASYEEQKIRRENLSGRNYEPADSGIGDFRRAAVRIPRARGTARTFSLACTDWVGSQYYWGVHTCASPKKSQVFFSLSQGEMAGVRCPPSGRHARQSRCPLHRSRSKKLQSFLRLSVKTSFYGFRPMAEPRHRTRSKIPT